MVGVEGVLASEEGCHRRAGVVGDAGVPLQYCQGGGVLVPFHGEFEHMTRHFFRIASEPCGAISVLAGS